MGHFGPKVTLRPQSSGCALKIFLKILYNERDQETYEIYISDLFKKGLVEGEWVTVGPKI